MHRIKLYLHTVGRVPVYEPGSSAIGSVLFCTLTFLEPDPFLSCLNCMPLGACPPNYKHTSMEGGRREVFLTGFSLQQYTNLKRMPEIDLLTRVCEELVKMYAKIFNSCVHTDGSSASDSSPGLSDSALPICCPSHDTM